MPLISSFRPSARIKRLSKRISKPVDQGDFLRAFTKDATTLWDNDHVRARNELFELVESDADLKAVLEQYGAGREQIQTAFGLLRVTADEWVGGNYVPVSSLCFPATLAFALSKTTDGTIRLDDAQQLVTAFKRGNAEVLGS